MFWGLIMEPNKRYTQTVEKSFHVSMASLDLTNADENIVQVMLYYEDRNYLLCSLKKGTIWQVPLDLNFQEGTKIAFTCNGHGHVHLTGYLIPDEDLDLDELEEEEEDEDEQVPQLVGKQAKRKAAELKEKKKVKRSKRDVETESSDDDDLELDGVNEEDDSEELEEEEDSMLVEGEEDDDSEEEDEDDEDEEEEEEVQTKVVKPQKKDKKKQAQKQEQQQKEKQDKKQLVNGKEAKQEQQGKQKKKNKGEQQQNVQNAQSEQKKKVVEGGVQVEELKVGSGALAKPGKFISVYYVGRLKNGKKFDATTQGDGFSFRLGRGEVIKGWDVGIAGMKVGGKRRITIPPAMAYGAKGSPPVIPGNSTLIFEVELRNIR